MKNERGTPKVKGPFLSALAAYATNKLAALGECVDVKYELQYILLWWPIKKLIGLASFSTGNFIYCNKKKV